ncbi:hypothetical protein B0T17DRAFT_528479 [Bombardia bombarda]|uniref:Ankyrin n=1 Tax=Bombardia bombarda TaxID=252184 RepID=A0AA39XAQ9_9PEZI|nr:hypothetical protein B0T17DRAFT_528479 [Bombardia bombarda]
MARWLRRHRATTLQSTDPAQPGRHQPVSSLPATTTTTTTTTTTNQPLEPPPPYSPPSASYDGVASEHTPGAMASAAPGYSPSSASPSHQIPMSTDMAVPRSVEMQRLAAVFVLHPWRHSWGPRPTSLADALSKAAFHGNERLVMTLIDAGAEVRGNQHSAIQTSTAVHEALRGPSPQIALKLLGHVGVSGQVQELLESRDAGGCTPLHIAAEMGETEIARELVRSGASLGPVDMFGRTPLHMAARYGRIETVDLLLDCGADTASIDPLLWLRASEYVKEYLGSYELISEILRDGVNRIAQRTGAGIVSRHQPPVVPIPNAGSLSQGSNNNDTQPPQPDTTPSDIKFKPNMENVRQQPPRDINNPFTKQMEFIEAFSRLLNPAPFPQPGLQPQSYPQSSYDPSPLAPAGGPSSDSNKVMQHFLGQQHGVRNTSRSMFGTPEYARWKRDCETLEAEMKAQKEKNKREAEIQLMLA